MEKLIELLNDYDSGWSYDDYYGPYQCGQDRDAYHLCKYQLVSKEYGFIKWLIDNYYIELPMGLWVVKSYDKESGLFNYFSDYESLLMLLSIQENPIEFLIKLIQ